MKKEINNLLSSKDSYLQINDIFALHHWILEKDNDFIGREGDFLCLECINISASVRSMCIYIESRDVQGIMCEVENAMDKMMNSMKENMIRKFKGGILI